MPFDSRKTTEAFKYLVNHDRQGGGLHFNSEDAYPITSESYTTAVRYPDGYKPFKISIWDTTQLTEVTSLTLMVNPEDIAHGNVNLQTPTYTRKGWVTSFWGSQQPTLSTTGKSAGFYYDSKTTVNGAKTVREGIVNYHRKNSISFINLLTLVAMFKNNGYYHLNTEADQTIFRDGTGRVIHVMDQIRIDYDGVKYFGSFNTFTIDETVESPFRLGYNFEFVVSSINSGFAEGHIKQSGNEIDRRVEVAIQGSAFLQRVNLSEEELNEQFHIDNVPEESVSDEYTTNEALEEIGYYKDWGDPVSIPTGTIRVTRGGLDNEPHDNKIDYRTSDGRLHSFLKGTVNRIVNNKGERGSAHLVTIKSNYGGEDVLLRYYHLDPRSFSENGLSEGSEVDIGTFIGYEGTDGGKYPQHCDLAMCKYISGKTYYQTVIADPGYKLDVTKVFEEGVFKLCQKYKSGETEYKNYQNINYKHGRRTGTAGNGNQVQGTDTVTNTDTSYPVCNSDG